MKPRIILHNSISVDGALIDFNVYMFKYIEKNIALKLMKNKILEQEYIWLVYQVLNE